MSVAAGVDELYSGWEIRADFIRGVRIGTDPAEGSRARKVWDDNAFGTLPGGGGGERFVAVVQIETVRNHVSKRELIACGTKEFDSGLHVTRFAGP